MPINIGTLVPNLAITLLLTRFDIIKPAVNGRNANPAARDE